MELFATRNFLVANLGVKFAALHMWTQYMEDALLVSGGRQVHDTEWDDVDGRFDWGLRHDFVRLLR